MCKSHQMTTLLSGFIAPSLIQLITSGYKCVCDRCHVIDRHPILSTHPSVLEQTLDLLYQTGLRQ